jgi:phage antirepressor YoqD-like protein
MQLAETKSEISFGEIQQHMQLGENEVEEFLIDRKFEVFYFDAFSHHLK